MTRITGTAGADALTGTANADIIDGGAGIDTMTGGLGHDTYTVDDDDDDIVEVVGGGTDTAKSSVTYTLPANVENLTLTGSANIDGTGNDWDNIIIGNAGNNILDGKEGSDVLKGGAGNDTYILGLGDTLSDSKGTDTVLASFETYTLPKDIESITFVDPSDDPVLSPTDVALTGNKSANTLTGAGGNDTLNGLKGNDTMIGGDGDDEYTVDSSGDVITEAVGEGEDTANISVTYSMAAGADIEIINLTGSKAINITGSNTANEINGNSAKNIIHGGSGADTIYGGGGKDSLFGDAGADTFVFKSATAYSSRATLSDYDVTEGDVIDISDLLTGYSEETSVLSDFVKIADSGRNSIMSVNADGSGSDFVPVLMISGINGLTGEVALVNAVHLITVSV